MGEHADQWHHPPQFLHAKIRSDLAGDRTRIAKVGGEQTNRSATVAPQTKLKLPPKYRRRAKSAAGPANFFAYRMDEDCGQGKTFILFTIAIGFSQNHIAVSVPSNGLKGGFSGLLFLKTYSPDTRRSAIYTVHGTRSTKKHCTPVESLVRSGDGALDTRCSVALIAPTLLSLKREHRFQVAIGLVSHDYRLFTSDNEQRKTKRQIDECEKTKQPNIQQNVTTFRKLQSASVLRRMPHDVPGAMLRNFRYYGEGHQQPSEIRNPGPEMTSSSSVTQGPRTDERVVTERMKTFRDLQSVRVFRQRHAGLQGNASTQWRVVKCCKVSWCLLSAVHTRRTHQEPVTRVKPGETECTAATHEKAARHPLHTGCRCPSPSSLRVCNITPDTPCTRDAIRKQQDVPDIASCVRMASTGGRPLSPSCSGWLSFPPANTSRLMISLLQSSSHRVLRAAGDLRREGWQMPPRTRNDTRAGAARTLASTTMKHKKKKGGCFYPPTTPCARRAAYLVPPITVRCQQIIPLLHPFRGSFPSNPYPLLVPTPRGPTPFSSPPLPLPRLESYSRNSYYRLTSNEFQLFTELRAVLRRPSPVGLSPLTLLAFFAVLAVRIRSSASMEGEAEEGERNNFTISELLAILEEDDENVEGNNGQDYNLQTIEHKNLQMRTLGTKILCQLGAEGEFLQQNCLNFFDDGAVSMFVTQSNRYAARKNKLGVISCEETNCFIGKLFLSGYAIVSNTLSRDRFQFIMSNFHCCNNENLDVSDQVTKVQPLFTLLNERFQAYAPHSDKHSVDKPLFLILDVTAGSSLSGPGEVEGSSVASMHCEDWQSTKMAEALEKPPHRSAQGQPLQTSLHPHLHPSSEHVCREMHSPCIPAFVNDHVFSDLSPPLTNADLFAKLHDLHPGIDPTLQEYLCHALQLCNQVAAAVMVMQQVFANSCRPLQSAAMSVEQEVHVVAADGRHWCCGAGRCLASFLVWTPGAVVEVMHVWRCSRHDGCLFCSGHLTSFMLLTFAVDDDACCCNGHMASFSRGIAFVEKLARLPPRAGLTKKKSQCVEVVIDVAADTRDLLEISLVSLVARVWPGVTPYSPRFTLIGSRDINFAHSLIIFDS
ncbi:hypothetical protein PR048_029274 [Dryococelus australis]|uniref:PiggyBac transposable element-derived protein domain-containing protein n=1 Tax=Dryococelus australis TaxID=614101 RepID=A0ABQ9GFP2_9NEOP|nr:hypothetical protein PR048_029274 [Dryococelus australis]